MKTKPTTIAPRKLLALLLALAMAVGLALPALAAGEDQVQVSLPLRTITKTGDTVTLEAQVTTPAGFDAELHYEWYEMDWRMVAPSLESFANREWTLIEGADSSKLVVSTAIEDMNLPVPEPGSFDFSTVAFYQTKLFGLNVYYFDDDAGLVRITAYSMITCTYRLDACYQMINGFAKTLLGNVAGLEFMKTIAQIVFLPLVPFAWLCAEYVYFVLKFLPIAW